MSDIRYSINGQILTDMADAIRTHRDLVSATCSIGYLGNQNQDSQSTNKLSATLPKGKTYKMTFKASYARNNTDQYYRATPTIKENNADGAVIYQDLVKQDSETVIVFTAAADITDIHVSLGQNCFLNMGDVKIEPSDAEGNLTGYFTPQQMVDAVSAALPTKEELVLTGNCAGMFEDNKWKWFLEKYGNLMTTKDITSADQMFNNASIIPFTELNFSPFSTVGAISMFAYTNIYTPPRLNNFKPGSLMYTFQGCKYIREFPEGYFDNWNWSAMDSGSYAMSGFISDCSSLRRYPMEVLQHGNKSSTSSTYSWLNGLLKSNVCLDEMINIPKPPNAEKSVTSNLCSNTANNTYRLKDFTFEPGITLKWSKQTLDLSVNTGFIPGTTDSPIISNNSGITADKKVSDDASYQALKNDPDWYAANIDYSRYNHDSAVRTINSLPTMTGTGNTIKFKGAAGAKTDGGAINTLTESEIAVAAAKGWTVSLV